MEEQPQHSLESILDDSKTTEQRNLLNFLNNAGSKAGITSGTIDNRGSQERLSGLTESQLKLELINKLRGMGAASVTNRETAKRPQAMGFSESKTGLAAAPSEVMTTQDNVLLP